MAMEWDTAALLTAIRAEGRLPADDPDATNTALLAIADRVMQRTFVPVIRKARSEYYVRHTDYVIATGRDEYPIPARAAGMTIREVVWLDTAGYPHPITPEPLGDRFDYGQTTGSPCHYTIEDDQIILLPSPSGALGTLRLYYEQLPGQLVPPSFGLTVAGAAYSTVTNRLTIDGTIVNADGDFLDVVNALPPFNVLAAGAVIVDSGVNYVEFAAADMPSRFLAGGWTAPTWVCQVGETPVPQIPAELHPVLAQLVAAQYLLPIDPEGGGVLKADAQTALDGQIALLTPRQIGRQQKIRASASMMRRGGRRGGYRGRLE